MLLELRVKNLGIIEDMTWQPGAGLNVITGETGAGKSLVIDAVELLLSGKADENIIRFGANEAYIEGVFDLSRCRNADSISEVLSEKNLAAEDKMLVVSCQLRRSGPAITRINTHAVPRALLHRIGCLLVDIHGQSEHLSLLDVQSHLNFLDAYAHALDLRGEFAAKVTAFRQTEADIASLAKNEKERAQREEFLRFQIDEITQAELRESEEEELEQERRLLSSAEKLKEYSYSVYQALYEQDSSGSEPAVDRLNHAVQALKKLVELDPSLMPQLKYLEETVYGLTEAARDIHAYGERQQFDPQRIEEVESRLELIRKLKRKYGVSIKEILDYRETATRELDGISGSTEKRLQLVNTLTMLRKELGQTGFRLSQLRTKAAGQLADAVKKELRDLNMAEVEFQVSLSQQTNGDGIPFPDGQTYAFNNDGADTIEFMVSTNPGEPVRPLAKIASTGEMSRFTLALKSALSEVDSTPVLVFDEIELGIGGRSGETIGQKLWRLGQRRQVICVTHLPQIAAFADAHFSVQKVTSGERTLSILETLDEKARVDELAAMLTGPRRSASALSNAREFMQKAKAWKAAGKKSSR